ncbi:MAG: hypothetical protein ACE5JG_07135, partial [Planctomycetota bacterium]
MSPLLLAVAVAVVPGEGVPESVARRAGAVLERALHGVEGSIELHLFRTASEMERAAGRGRAAGFAAWYDPGRRRVLAWMAPRPEEALWRDGLTGALLGALVHEAEHVRGGLSVPGYGRRPLWRREGEADRDAAALLAGALADLPGAGALR